jgi:hypothetical protein
MNSYNENLNSSIVSSLSDQELEMQKAKAKRDTSKFSLYYAQGETITAAERLEKANEEYLHQQSTLEEAVIDSDFSTNVLSSANASKKLVDQSVTNTAVAAANVQIATNAIRTLASDIGGVYNIVNAGDYGTEIHDQSSYANKVISKTAYLAEKTSDKSMNTSASIAEVSITSLATKTEVVDTSIKSLLEVVDTNFKAKTEEVLIDNDALSKYSTEEKVAEGNLELSNVNYNAISDAYDLSNCELNLNLKVLVPDPTQNTGDFVVSFNRYNSAFPERIEDITNVGDDIEIGNPYPVDAYFIMLVKYDRSTIFSVANAEAIILEDEQNEDGKYRYLYVDPTETEFIPNPFPFPMPFPPFTIAKNHFKRTLNLGEELEKINNRPMLDTDGMPMEPGTDYVVFVFALLSNDYKKVINSYDDFLSAPSKPFKMTTYLQAVDSNIIKVLGSKKGVSEGKSADENSSEGESPEGESSEVNKSEVDLIDLFNLKEHGKYKDFKFDLDISDKEKIYIKDGKLIFENQFDLKVDLKVGNNIDLRGVLHIDKQKDVKVEKGKQIVVFATPKESNDSSIKKQYRCMFLVNDPESTKNLLTADELTQIQKITDKKDEVVFFWSQQIKEMLDKIEEQKGIAKNAENEIDEIDKNHVGKKMSLTITKKRETKDSILTDSKEKLKKFNIELNELLVDENIKSGISETPPEVPEFYFDLTIAEKVPFGSYAVVSNKIEVFDFDIWYFQIESSTTDNFGNRLILNNEYIPTILTISDDETYRENSKYTNAMSDITSKGIFTYENFSDNQKKHLNN